MNRLLLSHRSEACAVLDSVARRANKIGRDAQGEIAARIRAVLETQVAAWNAGKLEEFMVGYWNSPELSFFSGGRQNSRDGKRPSSVIAEPIRPRGKEMGKLTFSDLEHRYPRPGRRFGARRDGSWSRRTGSKPGGILYAHLSAFSDGWKIMHDHTSSRHDQNTVRLAFSRSDFYTLPSFHPVGLNLINEAS